MLSLLRRPQLRRLWLGEAISLLGDWLSYVALSVVALEQGQGAMALAVAATAACRAGAKKAATPVRTKSRSCAAITAPVATAARIASITRPCKSCVPTRTRRRS